MSLRKDYVLTTEEEERAAALWTDPEIISEAMQDPPCLEYRGVRQINHPDGSRSHYVPPVRTGADALKALSAKDFAEFGRLCWEDANRIIRERAVDELADEEADREIDARDAA